MTVAVCIECGSIKHGALNPCTKCNYTPIDNEAKARSMIVTDHFQSQSDLGDIAERIRTGEPVTYPQEAVDDYIKMFEENPSMDRELARVVNGCFAVVAFLVISIVIAVFYFAS